MLLLLGLVLAAANEPETFFKLYGTTPKCFLIDEPVGTLVHAHYRLAAAPNGRNTQPPQLAYRLTFPKESNMATVENDIDADGVVMFTTKVVGVHSLCFSVKNAPRFDKENKLYLNLEVGVDAIDMDTVADASQFDDLERRIMVLSKTVETLQNEITFQGSRHDEFTQVTKSTITRVKIFFVVDLFFFALLGFLVYRNLRGFFRHIKVV